MITIVTTRSDATIYSEAWFSFRLQRRLQTMNLHELLKQPEGKTLEFKRDLSSPEGALRTIVAFANTARRVASMESKRCA